ncbi:MAG: hypothetical protein HY816_16880 [Candidatus Wallbacteria bacterium]|nr:hypothetical protein [Candidatus Wallbacteria bacterium]
MSRSRALAVILLWGAVASAPGQEPVSLQALRQPRSTQLKMGARRVPIVERFATPLYAEESAEPATATAAAPGMAALPSGSVIVAPARETLLARPETEELIRLRLDLGVLRQLVRCGIDDPTATLARRAASSAQRLGRLWAGTAAKHAQAGKLARDLESLAAACCQRSRCAQKMAMDCAGRHYEALDPRFQAPGR